MFRFVFMFLAAIGLAALLFGGAGGLAVGAGWLLLAPLVIVFKIMLFVMIFGMFKYAFRGGHRRSDWGPWGWRPTPPRTSERPSTKDQFEDWHRMEHAREEVDKWVEGEL